MRYYLRQAGSETIRGPFTLAEVEEKLPEDLGLDEIEALPDHGYRKENIPKSAQWIPAATLLERIARSKVPITFYGRERAWISILSKFGLFIVLGHAAYFVLLWIDLHDVFLLGRAMAIGTFGSLAVLGIQYGILMLADIADVQRGAKKEE